MLSSSNSKWHGADAHLVMAATHCNPSGLAGRLGVMTRMAHMLPGQEPCVPGVQLFVAALTSWMLATSILPRATIIHHIIAMWC